MLRCMPWWEAYASARAAAGDAPAPRLDGFHTLLRGIELDKVCVCVGGWGLYVRV